MIQKNMVLISFTPHGQPYVSERVGDVTVVFAPGYAKKDTMRGSELEAKRAAFQSRRKKQEGFRVDPMDFAAGWSAGRDWAALGQRMPSEAEAVEVMTEAYMLGCEMDGYPLKQEGMRAAYRALKSLMESGE